MRRPGRLRDLSPQAAVMGLTAALVGYASSFAVVLQGLSAAGASPAGAASGLAALCIAMGLAGLLLSLASRLPVAVAWSTPGAALLAASAAPPGGFAEAVGAFVSAAVLVILAGLLPPLARAVAAIPKPLANAMLAGILASLCTAPFRALADMPAATLTVIAGWVAGGLASRFLAVPGALAGLAAAAAFGTGTASAIQPAASLDWTAPVLVVPAFTLPAFLGLALPLFVVTMASQNIPGLAVMASNGYPQRPGLWLPVTGLASLLAAPFGGHAVNLAAITAAMCAGPEAHPDPARRYWAAAIAGAAYVGFGLASGLVAALTAVAPPPLIAAVAGLALTGSFATAAVQAFTAPDTREAAAVTFLMAASGIAILGVAGAFWGLVGGAALLWLGRFRRW
jgi:benzoate membrane transport protein